MSTVHMLCQWHRIQTKRGIRVDEANRQLLQCGALGPIEISATRTSVLYFIRYPNVDLTSVGLL